MIMLTGTPRVVVEKFGNLADAAVGLENQAACFFTEDVKQDPFINAIFAEPSSWQSLG